MSGEHGQPLGGLPAHVRRSLLAVLVVAVAVASDACDASVGDAAALAAAVKRAGSDACVGRTSVVAVTADIALAAPVHVWANASVSLVGPRAISGAGDHGLFVTRGRLALSGLRLADGAAASGGCVFVGAGGSLAASNASFVRCAAANYGGAIYASGAEVTLRNVSFSRTSAAYVGGAVSATTRSSVRVVDCTFEATTVTRAAAGGGALALMMSEATIVASAFLGTRSAAAGGALYVEDESNCSVSRSLFRATSAASSGGAVALVGGGSLALEDTVFEGAAAKRSGGAVLVSGGAAAAVGATFDRCVAAYGGAVHLEAQLATSTSGSGTRIASDLDLRRCAFSSCRATAGDGGGVSLGDGGSTARVGDDTSFVNCSASKDGGGVASAGRATLGRGLVFRGNVAETGGGGGAYLRNVSGSLVVRDAVFAENRCRTSGGGLFVEFQASKPRVECARCPVEMAGQPCAYAKNGTWRSWDLSSDAAVVGSTFVGNEANFSAGGLGVTGGVRMTLKDTSFHRNSARISVLRP